RKRAYCLKIQPATGSFARNLIYSTKPSRGVRTSALSMQDEYGLTLKEGEADMYKHSTNRDVRYAERELHFVIPSTVQGITHLAIFFSSSMQKDANRPLIPSSDTGAASYFTC
ncbi:hypothetical protein, partial [Klebsiella pneumoniae]